MKRQQTIEREAELSGKGLFTGEPVSLKVKPGEPDTGIWFVRTDQSPSIRIPALVENVSKRARRTADAVAEQCAFDGPVHLDRRLYLADPGAIVDVVQELGDDNARVLVVGHNPGLEELVAGLTGTEDSLPTAALAQVDLPIDHWTELAPSTRGRLVGMWRPKEID